MRAVAIRGHPATIAIPAGTKVRKNEDLNPAGSRSYGLILPFWALGKNSRIGWRFDGSAVGAGPTGRNFGSPGHAPRYDRGIGSVAVRMRSVLQTTTGPCPSHPTATEGQRAQGVEPQTGLQHGAGPRSRERVSTPKLDVTADPIYSVV